MDRWRGKVALVTGASAGIGRAVAKELVQQGLVVVGVARRLHLLEELSQEVSQLSLPGQLVPRQLDVTEDEAVEATFRWADDTLGGVDVLVNAAGVTSSCSLLATIARHVRAAAVGRLRRVRPRKWAEPTCVGACALHTSLGKGTVAGDVTHPLAAEPLGQSPLLL
ncbi:farnesol dehydrogenase-like [Schistocerca nitens]|uniref:farnesol dehydrogenase-like n=1 Tax=Schistocerca nitens TaxID=7011 RepID=UPI0021173B80|nr:farnesol dehydrogenase-like [Schistocerca nitens]